MQFIYCDKERVPHPFEATVVDSTFSYESEDGRRTATATEQVKGFWAPIDLPRNPSQELVDARMAEGVTRINQALDQVEAFLTPAVEARRRFLAGEVPDLPALPHLGVAPIAQGLMTGEQLRLIGDPKVGDWGWFPQYGLGERARVLLERYQEAMFLGRVLQYLRGLEDLVPTLSAAWTRSNGLVTAELNKPWVPPFDGAVHNQERAFTDAFWARQEKATQRFIARWEALRDATDVQALLDAAVAEGTAICAEQDRKAAQWRAEAAEREAKEKALAEARTVYGADREPAPGERCARLRVDRDGQGLIGSVGGKVAFITNLPDVAQAGDLVVLEDIQDRGRVLKARFGGLRKEPGQGRRRRR
jgi:hypothetical protein